MVKYKYNGDVFTLASESGTQASGDEYAELRAVRCEWSWSLCCPLPACLPEGLTRECVHTPVSCRYTTHMTALRQHRASEGRGGPAGLV